MDNREREELGRIRDDLLDASYGLLQNAETLEALLKVVPGSVKLEVPYLSQWGPTANKRRGDCGPACVAMVTHYETSLRPTVDDAAAMCRQPESGRGSYFTTMGQLKAGLRGYGIEADIAAPYSAPEMTVEMLKSKVAGLPSIALIDYRMLRELTNPVPGIVHNQDQGYNFGHWVLFVGYGGGGVYIHDPDFWGDRVGEGAFRFVPEQIFAESLRSPAQGNTYGSQGLVLVE